VLADEASSKPELVELEVPAPGAGEVRVKVAAASVNGFDLAVAAGVLKGLLQQEFPTVLGKDFAGTVDAVGAGVSGYTVGDRVFGTVMKPVLRDGSFAEYVTVLSAVGLAPLPDQIDFAEGAALGLAGSAAYASVEAASLVEGQSVLVVGATGGVGLQVVQLALVAGSRVVATAVDADGAAALAELGVDQVVDLGDGDLLDQVRRSDPDGFHAVVHLAGDMGVISAVRPGGRFVSTLIFYPGQVSAEGVTVVPVVADPTPDVLRRIVSDRLDGKTRVRVQASFPLERLPDAFAAFAAGTVGKIIVDVGA
jgi:NADPH:quinone reductase